MPNNDIVINIFRFIIVLILQIFLLNNINFLGYVNPYLYILFILLYPLNGNKGLLIFLSFLLGLTVDIFGDSGGVHAAASVFIAYMRPLILKFSFGISYEYNAINIQKADIGERVVYFSAMILLHHFILFLLEIFSINHILLILKSTLFSGIFTLILILCTTVLFSKKSS